MVISLPRDSRSNFLWPFFLNLLEFGLCDDHWPPDMLRLLALVLFEQVLGDSVRGPVHSQSNGLYTKTIIMKGFHELAFLSRDMAEGSVRILFH